MPTTSDFLQYSLWSGIVTLIIAIIAVLAFILQWGFRFRLVGSTGFMVVLTVGLFTLSLVPISRTVIPGAVHYSLIYDNGATQAVITTPTQISAPQLEATLRQAASDLYSYGRLGTTGDNELTIRARTLLHPEPGISVPLYLGQVKRSLATREDPQMAIEIYHDKLAQIPKPTPEKVRT